MKQYAIDTNLLFNMEADLGLGNTTEAIMRGMTKAFEKAQKDKEFAILLPPSIVEEIKSFFKNPQEQTISAFLGSIIVKSPDIPTLQLSSNVVHQIINEYRTRSYRGMKVAEEELIATAQMFMGKEALAHQEFQMTIGKRIAKLRDRFRNATRTGIIDSVADIELILLAKEQDAFLVSTDGGVISWGRKMGVKEMSSSVFGKMIQAYL